MVGMTTQKLLSLGLSAVLLIGILLICGCIGTEKPKTTTTGITYKEAIELVKTNVSEAIEFCRKNVSQRETLLCFADVICGAREHGKIGELARVFGKNSNETNSFRDMFTKASETCINLDNGFEVCDSEFCYFYSALIASRKNMEKAKEICSKIEDEKKRDYYVDFLEEIYKQLDQEIMETPIGKFHSMGGTRVEIVTDKDIDFQELEKELTLIGLENLIVYEGREIGTGKNLLIIKTTTVFNETLIEPILERYVGELRRDDMMTVEFYNSSPKDLGDKLRKRFGYIGLLVNGSILTIIGSDLDKENLE
ncbi:MAG: hypothetical protein KAU03_04300, partial [Candidatus Altiarchaeales archaeon]|nr:hypothetical protein [Candidatus Altiarchaeales archaeon]